jgi:hypothetical protein
VGCSPDRANLGARSALAWYRLLVGKEYGMSYSVQALLDSPQTYSHWLRAELLGYLRCPEDVRAAVRERLCIDPSFRNWCGLLEELEAGGQAMREAVRSSLETVTRPI